MAIEQMADAIPGEGISSAEYNKVTANVRNLDQRVSGVEAGAIRYRTIRATSGNVTSGVFEWPDDPEYAQGISMRRNNTAAQLSTPGMYLVVAQIGINAVVSSGKRMILFVSLTDDTDSRFGETVYPLPSSMPQLQAVAPVLITQPTEISVNVWTDSTAKLPLYVGTNRSSLTITYLGGA